MIRGGIEYGLGVYITGVDNGSVASKNKLRVIVASLMTEIDTIIYQFLF